MGFTTKKYGVLINFCCKVAFFGKTKSYYLYILSQNFNFLKPVKICIQDHYV
jgi:hypothetical protein